MEWFGESWNAPINSLCPQIPTPVGRKCEGCSDTIGEKDSGFALPYIGHEFLGEKFFHKNCLIGTIVPTKRSVYEEALKKGKEVKNSNNE